MMLTRRNMLRALAGTCATATVAPSRLFALSGAGKEAYAGQFAPTRDSLANYRIPEWFGKAKFGIWSHWGPQSSIEQGDWYARNMYMQGSNQYLYHCETYGHPTKVGYKDLVPQFKAADWDPDYLMDLYVKAGAKYFFSMGVHHDNFDMWNSKYQPRWNAVATGPKKDIVGLYKVAARKRGLYFGVSEHLSNSFDWLLPSHASDQTGPLAGVPYDGTDPAYADLYHSLDGMPADFVKQRWKDSMGRVAPDRWKEQYVLRVNDLIDQHQPDLLYTDGGIPFDTYGLATVAELYNVSKAHHDAVQAVYFSKTVSDCKTGTCALDRERGVLDVIAEQPWQSDTCIGSWHYQRGAHYKNGKKVIDLLVDIVSKNGNLLLNIPLPNRGVPDYEELVVLDEITQWMRVNGEGIYETRPWKINGEGPAMKVEGGSGFNESKKPDLTAQDVRFTQKRGVLYAFVMGWPEKEFTVESLSAAKNPGKIANVTVLGYDAPLKWTQADDALRVELPKKKLSDIGSCLMVRFA